MKKITLDNSPVTKTELKEVLKDYPTKDELSERLEKSFAAFRVEMHYEMTNMEERLNEKISSFSNRILTAIDPLLRELETRQQDREIAAAQMRNFEERLTKLEYA